MFRIACRSFIYWMTKYKNIGTRIEREKKEIKKIRKTNTDSSKKI